MVTQVLHRIYKVHSTFFQIFKTFWISCSFDLIFPAFFQFLLKFTTNFSQLFKDIFLLQSFQGSFKKFLGLFKHSARMPFTSFSPVQQLFFLVNICFSVMNLSRELFVFSRIFFSLFFESFFAIFHLFAAFFLIFVFLPRTFQVSFTFSSFFFLQSIFKFASIKTFRLSFRIFFAVFSRFSAGCLHQFLYNFIFFPLKFIKTNSTFS